MIRTQLGEVIVDDQPPFDADATIAVVQAGDTNAFGEIYSHLAPQVHSFLMGLSGGDEALAEDYTQDTFGRAFNSVGTYQKREKGSVKSWLRQIAYNLYLDGYRRKQRIIIEPAGDDLYDLSDAAYNTHGQLEEEVDTRIDLGPYAKNVHNAMTKEFAQAVCAVHELDMGYRGASQALGVKANTIRSRLHRGRLLARTVEIPEGYGPVG